MKLIKTFSDVIVALLGLVFVLGIPATILYIAIHFISKYW